MGVYNRFGGKDSLVGALIVRGFDRLRIAMEGCPESGPQQRLRPCARCYRQFALANPHLYTLMFQGTAVREQEPPEAGERAAAAFMILVRNVELALAAVHVQPDATEAAQQLWGVVHGAVALELNGLIRTANADATFESLLKTLISGWCPAGTVPPGSGSLSSVFFHDPNLRPKNSVDAAGTGAADEE